MDKIILRATDLDGYLTDSDKKYLKQINNYYFQAQSSFEILASSHSEQRLKKEKRKLVRLFTDMGDLMQELSGNEKQLHIYPFDTPEEIHGEASRLIAKLRSKKTQDHEFVYYIQRAYEMLFNLAFGKSKESEKKNYLIIDTPVTVPVQNYAIHKIPDVDDLIENTVMCVMLRGALLPSMIMSKEIQEYSSSNYLTPFALFKIKRDDTKKEHNMEYVLDLKRSFFDLDQLNGKDLIFADPMNATGGSFVTIVKYIIEQGVKPKSIKFFNVISALKGSLRIIRAIENIELYTLWMDPVVNEMAYIAPGLGDAGDRINGSDFDDSPRNIIQLIADYGANISAMYRSQVREIEKTVLEK